MLACGAALLAVGCGDESDGTAAATTALGETVPAAVQPFCDAFGGLLVGPLASGTLDASDPEALRPAVEATAELVAELRATAPADIAAVAGEVADAYDATFAVLERFGYDLVRLDAEGTPADVAALDAVDRAPSGPNLDDPFALLETYFSDRCAAGVSIPPELLPSTTTAPP